MVHLELLSDRGIAIVSLEGPLVKADFEQLAEEVDPLIASRGKLTGLMICAKSFPGWDSFGALVSHFKFVASHHRQIDRIAALTDSEFLKIMPWIADYFVQAKVKHFDFGDRDQALAWLAGG